MLRLAFWVGPLVLLTSAVLLTVVLLTQGVDQAKAWAGVAGAGVTIAGALVALVRWWLKKRTQDRRLASSEQVAQAAQELQAAVRKQ